MSIETLRTLARELAGEAWDYERRQLAAQAYVRRRAARILMTQADTIQREDAMFEDPQAESDRSKTAPPSHESPIVRYLTPICPLFEHDRPGHALTARTADRAVL